MDWKGVIGMGGSGVGCDGMGWDGVEETDAELLLSWAVLS